MTSIEIHAPKNFVLNLLSNPFYIKRLFAPYSSYIQQEAFQIRYQAKTWGLIKTIERHISTVTPSSCRVHDTLSCSGMLPCLRYVHAYVLKEMKSLSQYQLARIQQDAEYTFKNPFKPCSVLITGASGFIGSSLKTYLSALGCTVYSLVRHVPNCPSEIQWDPDKGLIPLQKIEGIDVFINLSGASIAEKRWSASRMKLLKSSRLEATRTLVKAISQLKQPPRLFISMSGISIYGKGTFLAKLAEDWEKEAQLASPKTRVVLLRTATVLSALGGALPKITRSIRYGFAGRIGSGQQPLPWISLYDLENLILFCITHDEIAGPIDAVSSDVPTQKEFMRAIGKVIHRPTIIPLPALVVRLLFGKMGDELLLQGISPPPTEEKFKFVPLLSFLKTEIGNNS